MGVNRYMRARFGLAALVFGSFAALVNVSCTTPAIAEGIDYFNRLALELRTLSAQNRYAEALKVANEFERAAKETYGANSVQHAAGLNWQATLLQLTGHLDEAGRLFEQVLAIYLHALPPNHPDVASVLNNLGMHSHWMKKYDEAVEYFQKSLDIREHQTEPDTCQVADSLNNLAHTYTYIDRKDDARRLLERALNTIEQDKACRDLSVRILQNLAGAMEDGGDFRAAEDALRKALLLQHSTTRDAQSLAVAALDGRLGVNLSLQGQYAKASPFFSEALQTYRGNPDTPPMPLAATLQDYAANEVQIGNLILADSLLSEALKLREASLGPNHPDVARTLSDQADVAFRLRRQAEALQKIEQAASIASSIPDLHDQWAQLLFRRLVIIALTDKSSGKPFDNQDVIGRAFVAAQQAMLKETGDTVERAARRLSEKDERIRGLLKSSDDLNHRRSELDRALGSVYARPVEQRTDADRGLQAESANVLRQIQQNVRDLRAADPSLADLLHPEPLSLSDAKSALRADEALLLLLPVEDAIFAFAVTRERVAWKRQEFPAVELLSYVRELRAGLDGASAQDQKSSRSFSVGLAYKMDRRLFEGLDDILSGKHQLLIATTGALDTLPFHVLVTKPQAPGGPATQYKDAAWFARQYAVTVLPAVANLKSLRNASVHSAERPMIGFGNPLLEGNAHVPADVERARISRQWSSCARIPAAVLASTPSARGIRPSGHPKFGVGAIAETRGLVSVDAIREQAPLPETAYELCRVAASVKAAPEDVYLGARATVSTIRALNKENALARYRIVQFATHAAVAGELTGTKEPGLLLTPPAVATSDDDGYLSRDDVLSLNLNADWVVLSACNTAAPESSDAEGLSGLAQAFFHAGARALLVSHWYVDSAAAARLVTGSFEELEKEPDIGQAEALRRAMVSYIDDADEEHAAPSYWAPFVVVGAGIR